MFTFTALYSRPQDADGFVAEYRSDHLPIVQRWPNVRDSQTVVFDGTPRGGDPAYLVAFTARFDSAEDRMAALTSDAGGEAAQHARMLVEKYGIDVTMMLGQD